MLFYDFGDMKGGGDFEGPEPVVHNFHHGASAHNPGSDDSKSTGGGGGTSSGTLMSSPPSRPEAHKKQKKDTTAGAGDGASIEVGRRPRGRPLGSKNKPKPPVVIASDAAAAESPASLRPHVLEIPAGKDVAPALSGFCRRRNVGLSVLAATGAVSNVTFRQPSTASPSAGVTFHGRFELLSLAVTLFPPSFSPPVPSVPLSVSIAGPQGQIFGGVVIGPLVAAGTVTVVAATFSNPSLERIPAEEEVSMSGDGGSSRRDEAEAQEEEQLRQGGRSAAASRSSAAGMVESSPMSIFSRHLPSDASIWAAPTRTAHRPPY